MEAGIQYHAQLKNFDKLRKVASASSIATKVNSIWGLVEACCGIQSLWVRIISRHFFTLQKTGWIVILRIKEDSTSLVWYGDIPSIWPSTPPPFVWEERNKPMLILCRVQVLSLATTSVEGWEANTAASRLSALQAARSASMEAQECHKNTRRMQPVQNIENVAYESPTTPTKATL